MHAHVCRDGRAGLGSSPRPICLPSQLICIYACIENTWQPHHLYMRAYIRLQWKARRLPGAACLWQPYHVLLYMHRNWKSKQPAWGGLHRPAQYIFIHVNITTHGNKQPAWGSVIGAALPGPYAHASPHAMWESKQPAWGGRPRPHHLSIHGNTYI